MARPYKLTWHYQCDEEILETAIYYFNIDDDALEVDDLSNLAAGVLTRIAANVGDLLPINFKSWSVTCSTPAIGLEGPARHINAHGAVYSGEFGAISMDSFVLNAQLKGSNELLEPVNGGLKFSAIPLTFIDRNQIDATWASDMTDAFNLIFPQQIAINLGIVERCIKSVRPPADPEYVFPTTLVCSNQIGINLTRVGNRPQRNTGPAAP